MVAIGLARELAVQKLSCVVGGPRRCTRSGVTAVHVLQPRGGVVRVQRRVLQPPATARVENGLDASRHVDVPRWGRRIHIEAIARQGQKAILEIDGAHSRDPSLRWQPVDVRPRRQHAHRGGPSPVRRVLYPRAAVVEPTSHGAILGVVLVEPKSRPPLARVARFEVRLVSARSELVELAACPGALVSRTTPARSKPLGPHVGALRHASATARRRRRRRLGRGRRLGRRRRRGRTRQRRWGGVHRYMCVFIA